MHMSMESQVVATVVWQTDAAAILNSLVQDISCEVSPIIMSQGRLYERRSTVESTQLTNLSRLNVKTTA